MSLLSNLNSIDENPSADWNLGRSGPQTELVSPCQSRSDSCISNEDEQNKVLYSKRQALSDRISAFAKGFAKFITGAGNSNDKLEGTDPNNGCLKECPNLVRKRPHEEFNVNPAKQIAISYLDDYREGDGYCGSPRQATITDRNSPYPVSSFRIEAPEGSNNPDFASPLVNNCNTYTSQIRTHDPRNETQTEEMFVDISQPRSPSLFMMEKRSHHHGPCYNNVSSENLSVEDTLQFSARQEGSKQLFSSTMGPLTQSSLCSGKVLDPHSVRGRMLRQKSVGLSKASPCKNVKTPNASPIGLPSGTRIPLNCAEVDKNFDQNSIQLSHRPGFTGLEQPNQEATYLSGTDGQGCLMANVSSLREVSQIQTNVGYSDKEYNSIRQNRGGFYGNLSPQLSTSGQQCSPKNVMPVVNDSHNAGSNANQKLLVNNTSQFSSQHYPESKGVQPKRPDYVPMTCPSCKQLQNVLYCPGTIHTCTSCNNVYQFVERPIAPSQNKKEVNNSSPVASGAKKRPQNSKPRRSCKRTPQKPECVTIISSDEEESQGLGSQKAESTVGAPDKADLVRPKILLENNTSSGTEKTILDPKSKLSKKMKLKGGHNPNVTKDSIINDDEILSVAIDFIQFGSVPGKALEPMTLSGSSIYLKVGMIKEDELMNHTSEVNAAGSFSVNIKQNQISNFKLHVGRAPSLLVLHPTDDLCSKVNDLFGQIILDLKSSDFVQNQIVVTFARNPDSESEAEEVVRQVKANSGFGSMIELMSQKEAEHILSKIKSYGASDKICNSKLSSCQKSPESKSTEAAAKLKMETLLVYPKPAAHGSVTVTIDDLDCLADGVYLNDVIIDFYLRYLIESLLLEKDKKRTHLFSSFFYKRLTQKVPRYNLSDEMAKLSNPQRMHHLVKKWTRNVDIFEKDFILIPVNEHSHWYLVIICFPKLVPSEDDPKKSGDDSHHKDIEKHLDESLMEVDSPGLCGPSPAMETDDLDQSALSRQEASESHTNSNIASEETEKRTENKPLSAAFRSPSQSDTINALNPMPCILIFDSLGLRTSNRVFTNFRNYLTQEWKMKRPTEKLKVFDKDTMKGSFPKLPLQSNDCDCGIYLLQYAETFFTDPIVDFKPPIKKTDWFSKDLVNKKRGEIRDLIFKLREESQ